MIGTNKTMLTKICTDGIIKPIIEKIVDGENCSDRGAFPSDKKITFRVSVPRRLGASAVVLRINRDYEVSRDISLSFEDTVEGWDIYLADFFPAEAVEGYYEGLFYYEFLFLRGADTLFTSATNNVDFELEGESGAKFRLLIFDKDFTTPDWFKGRVMYHVFVDRFAKGVPAVPVRDDAVIDPDWYGGVPQYPARSGDRYPNNVFFGGNLWGVIEKLDYLASLGVGIIYLSPIFKAYSNHKYDTGNYLEIDEMFGGEEAFDKLLEEAARRDIKIILDGVFNHTGDDSLYFDKYGKYGGTGAYSNPNSPFRDWYNFKEYPDGYESWWGIDILPKLNHSNDLCREFFVGEGGVIEKYLLRGISGWRLDVADELPNSFIDTLRETAKKTSHDPIIIGEVWENAADKISYGIRRRYFGGRQLDSVMNYPLRNGILDYMRYGDAEILADTLRELYSSYPPDVCNCLMNILGTHDTERILTVLGGMCDESLLPDGLENSELAYLKMNEEQRSDAERLLMMAAVIQYTVFGVPSVYYGDEAGIEGYGDPFCRMPYPWGRESAELVGFYRRLGRIRSEYEAFAQGDFKILKVSGGFIAYSREKDKETVIIAINRSDENFVFELRGSYTELLSDTEFDGTVKADTAVILVESDIAEV